MLPQFKTVDDAVSHLDEIQRMAKIGSWELDLVTGELSWTAEIFNIFEIDPREFGASYSAFLEIVHPDDRQMVDDVYTASVKSRTAYECTHRLLFKDGRTKFVRERGKTRYSDSGEPLLSIGTVQDLTDETRNRLALEESTESLLFAEHLAGFGHYRLLTGSDTFFWSPNVYRITGRSPEHFVPTLSSVVDMIHPDDRHALISLRSKSMAGHDAGPITVRVLKPEGKIVYVEGWAKPQLASNGMVLSTFGTLQDITPRVESEIAFREASARHELIVNAVNDGVWDWNLKNSAFYVSPRWKTILGYQSDEQLIDEFDFFHSVHPDDIDGLRRLIDSHRNVDKPWSYECRRLHRSGVYVWVRCRGSVIRDHSGNPERMVGILTDISAEKMHKDTLKELEASRSLQNAITAAPVPIALFDLKNCLLSASEPWCKYFHLDSATSKVELSEQVSQQFPKYWREKFELAVSNGSADIEEAPWTSLQNETFSLKWLLRTWKDASGSIAGVVVYMEDNSNSRRADEERSRRIATLEWIETVSASLPGAIGTFKLDPEGRFSFPMISKQSLDLFGFTPETLRVSADPVLERIFPGDADRVIETSKQSKQTLTPWHGEYRYKHLVKGDIWIEGHSKPEIAPDGSCLWHGFIQDISQRKHVEQEAERKNVLLHHSQKMELVGQLAAGIAHDFNNLLAVISGSIEFVKDWMINGVLPEEQLITAAGNACQRGKELVQRLQQFSRQSPTTLQYTIIDPILLEILTLLSRTLGEEIEIKTHFAAGTAGALIDRSQLTTAILNLALNARDAMRSGGVLSISTWTEFQAHQSSEDNTDVKRDETIFIKISDTGSGMSDEVRMRALEPGFTTKPAGLGTGLGLSMVSSFLKECGGDMKIESAPYSGTTVIVRLPSTDEPLKKTTSDGNSAVQSIKSNKTVLLLEDDPDVSAIVGAQLKKLKFDVRRATTGAEALDILGSPAEVAILLTDLILRGDINGLDVVKEALRMRPRIGVVCMSGYSTAETNLNRLHLQNIELLQKPFSMEALWAALNKLAIDQH